MALVMEFCEKGMVSEVLIKEGEFFSWDDPMLKIIMDIARAMRYLHGGETSEASVEGAKRPTEPLAARPCQ